MANRHRHLAWLGSPDAHILCGIAVLVILALSALT
jgi:hypothetical protein